VSAAELLDALEQPMHAAAPSPYAEEAEISKRRQHRSAKKLNMTAEEAEITNSKRRQHRLAKKLNMTAANTVFDDLS